MPKSNNNVPNPSTLPLVNQEEGTLDADASLVASNLEVCAANENSVQAFGHHEYGINDIGRHVHNGRDGDSETEMYDIYNEDNHEEQWIKLDLNSAEAVTQLRNNGGGIGNFVLEASFNCYNITQDYTANDVDWAQNGHLLRDASHLHRICVEIDGNENRNVKAFMRSVAQSPYIRSLLIFMYGTASSEDVFSAISDIVTNNNHFCSLSILGGVSMNERSTQLLMSALSTNTCLRTFKFYCDAGLDDDQASTLIHLLSEQHNLEILDLRFGHLIIDSWCNALAEMIQSPGLKLRVVNLDSNDLGDKGLRVLGCAFLENATINELSFVQNLSITQRGWAFFMGCLRNSRMPLKTLTISSNNIGDESAAILADMLFLPHNMLKTLDLYQCSIGTTGVRRLSSVLWNPSCQLETLTLDGNAGIDDEGATNCARSLAYNSSLHYLYFNVDVISNIGWASFSKTLCDMSNMNSILGSNHTLLYIGDEISRLPADIEEFLDLNGANEDKVEVARQKIIFHYLSNGENTSNMQELDDMELNMRPSMMAWAGRNANGLPLLYKLVRSSMPDWVGN